MWSFSIPMDLFIIYHCSDAMKIRLIKWCDGVFINQAFLILLMKTRHDMNNKDPIMEIFKLLYIN